MRNPLRRRWSIWIVGVFSGSETELTFMRSWRKSTAERRAESLRENEIPNVRIDVRPLGGHDRR